MAVAANRLRVDAEQKADAEPHDLIGEQEENRRDEDHHEHHHGGDGRLLARRPGDLLRLSPHFLQELEWVDLRHVQRLVFGSLNRYSPPAFQEETATAVLFWGMFAAEVRYRAAGDEKASYCQLLKPSSLAAASGPRGAAPKTRPPAHDIMSRQPKASPCERKGRPFEEAPCA